MALAEIVEGEGLWKGLGAKRVLAGIWTLLLIGTVGLGIRLNAIASNPPLGLAATTTLSSEEIYIPPFVSLKKDFTNIFSKVEFLGGAGGVGDSQLKEWKDEYSSVAEASGSRNFMVVSEAEGCSSGQCEKGVVLTYVTYAGSRLHVYKEREEVSLQTPLFAHYNLVTEGKDHARIGDKGLTLHWEYEKDLVEMILVLFLLPMFAGVLLLILYEIFWWGRPSGRPI